MSDSNHATLASQLVGVLRTLAGAHGGYRPIHAKGVVGWGTFRGSPAAASISRAWHFQGEDVPATIRFSNAEGHPAAPDGAPGVRALSVKFALPDGTITDVLANSVEGFFAGTPEEFLSFLQALVPGPAGPDPDALSKALAAHPTAAAVFGRISQRPIPVSYAQCSYFAVHAFRFLASDGSVRFGRYQWVPEAGEAYLTPDEGARKGPGFLGEELAARIQSGPVVFRLMLQLAADGDPTEDCTKIWPGDRPVVELGRLEISSLAADSEQTERPLVFDPNNLTDGIEPSDDPILLIRKAAYADSFAIRNGEPVSAPY